MPPYSKPFLPITDQIAKLRSRGMLIADEDRAHRYLGRLGYYKLSGYWYPLRKSTIKVNEAGKAVPDILDDYRDGCEFEHVISLYVFDRKLKLIMMDVIERIEIALRTEVALRMGEYDPLSYREPKYLDGKFCTDVNQHLGKTMFQFFLDRYEERIRNSKEDFVTHFFNKYDVGPLPVWMSVEVWDFGMLSVFISGMKFRDQRHIAQKYNIPRAELLPSWVRSLGFVRNVCAHHSRLWNKTLTSQPRPTKAGEIPDLDHLVSDQFGRQRLYGTAAIARFLHKQINPQSRWNERFIETIGTLPVAPGINIAHAGFPNGWEGLPLWR